MTIEDIIKQLEGDALIGRFLMSKFDTHGNGWSIEAVFDGAPSLEELRDVLIEAAKKEPS